LGDQKPSHFLHHLKNLAGNNDILKCLFLDQMPVRIREILIASPEELDKLAALADRLIDIDQPSSAVFATTQVKSQLENQLAALTSKVDRLFQEAPRKPSARCPYRDSSPLRKPGSGSSNSNIYFYHHQCGARAKRCEKPCSWKPRVSNKQQEN